MHRREFVLRSGLIAGGMLSLSPLGCVSVGRRRIQWTRGKGTGLVSAVACEGEPLDSSNPTVGVLDGAIRRRGADGGEVVRLGLDRPSAQLGPLHLELKHRLLDSGAGEDLLVAEVSIRNEADQAQEAEATFLTPVQPGADIAQQHIYVPLSAAGGSRDRRFAALGVKGFLEDCQQQIGTKDFACHYLEPMASFPAERTTRALLLAPVVDVFQPARPWRVAMLMSPDQPARFRFTREYGNGQVWEAGRTVTVPPGQTLTLRCWLLVHRGDASEAWRAFHRFAHHDDHPAVDWTREFKVHYYDFLSSAQGKDGHRGDGYDADLLFFREFRVGMATQHGYYPHLGDYLHPDRKTWPAMRGDKQGLAEMSFEKMKARIRATRQAGARAAIYLHPVLFDDASPLFQKMRDCVLVDEKGEMARYPWQGPDTQGKNWLASLASARWREHLLQQAQWIMEILAPDAIVVDETFAGVGYDHHPDRAGPLSAGAIDFYRKLRTLVRSFGHDRAVFSSDCSLAAFVYWFDGECGDHAYSTLLGRSSYTQPPVRFLAALGDKPWRPCAWHFQGMWETQMKLARQVGAGVGVSNGWEEYTGLARLPADVKAKMLADIALVAELRQS
jgi:hypothetical protein